MNYDPTMLRQLPPRLKKSDQDRLFREALNGDPEAREAVIVDMVKLAVSVARSYGKGMRCINDLIQEACVGIIVGFGKHDGRDGVAITTVATYWAICSASNSIRASKAKKRLMIRGSLTGDLISDIPDPREASEPPDSDAIADLGNLLRLLTKRQREVVTHLYGLDGQSAKDQVAVAKELGFTRQRVSQLHIAALKRLRRHADGARRRRLDESPKGKLQGEIMSRGFTLQPQGAVS